MTARVCALRLCSRRAALAAAPARSRLRASAAAAPGDQLEILLKGVTFEGRQEAVTEVSEGQPVLLLRQPENPADEHAVQALTLRGTALGFVPRESTHLFAADSACATVASKGCNEAGVHWVTVRTVAGRPGLTADLHPAHVPPPNLSNVLPRTLWDSLRRAAYAEAGHRCLICSGKGAKWPVEAHERWHHDCSARRSTLLGLEALCPDCHQARHSKPTAAAAVAVTLSRVNRWTPEEAATYQRWVVDERSWRSELARREGWSLDVGTWLLHAEQEGEPQPFSESPAGEAAAESPQPVAGSLESTVAALQAEYARNATGQ